VKYYDYSTMKRAKEACSKQLSKSSSTQRLVSVEVRHGKDLIRGYTGRTFGAITRGHVRVGMF
jgi:hypothetical protein